MITIYDTQMASSGDGPRDRGQGGNATRSSPTLSVQTGHVSGDQPPLGVTTVLHGACDGQRSDSLRDQRCTTNVETHGRPVRRPPPPRDTQPKTSRSTGHRRRVIARSDRQNIDYIVAHTRIADIVHGIRLLARRWIHTRRCREKGCQPTSSPLEALPRLTACVHLLYASSGSSNRRRTDEQDEYS
jgi:hypothetical protein